MNQTILNYYRRRNRILWLKNTLLPMIVLVIVAIVLAAIWDERIGAFIVGR